ncbi:MAG: MBL fold metallo-hydrolase, partial [Solirubrobacterales bacterium]|nr:MBL fold metallo-hydrolase [Solirubrobacterales bacterium]
MREPVAEAPGHPEVVRILAPNPGPMTLEGTNTYVVGSSPAWIVDPGPADAGHIAEVREVAESRGGIGGVVLTHSHLDHNAGVELLGAGLAFGNGEGFDDVAAMFGERVVPPARLASGEGERVGPFQAYATPGHATDHVVFVLDEGEPHPRTRSGGGAEGAGEAPVVCFCGDIVLGEGSTIVPPASGGGSLADYMRSL